MSKLFKSKFFLGVMIVTVMLVGIVALTGSAKQVAAQTTTTTTTAAPVISITHTLREGSPYSSEVKILQTALGITADGDFGPMTKAAVEAWQTKEGLTADGVFGPLSLAAFGSGSMSMTYPAGCASASGYSATTGMACNTGTMVMTLPAGCASSSGYSPTTGVSCATGVSTVTTLPAGCVTSSGFSSTTGASCATGVSVSQSGPLSVSLSQDNPAAGYVIANQATADLAHFTITGTGVLNSITLQRTGISDQNTLANVYLYNGMTRLTDGYSFNNASVLTMNNLGIAVNGSLEISVKADISSTAGTTASTVGVTLTGYTAGTTASAANVAGNLMYVGVGSPATVYLPTQASVAVPNSTVNAGTSAYTVWSAPVQVNTRAVDLEGANFRMVGSAPVGALANIKLFVDGAQVGTPATVNAINGSNYAMFNFAASPVTLTTGSHTVTVEADIVSGSSYTVQVSLQQAADLVILDPQLNIDIAPSVSSSVSFASNNAGTITINAGTASVVVDPTFSSMTNVTGGATQVDIGDFDIYGYGEPVKVSTLSVTPVLTGCTPTCAGLNNVTVYFGGSQIGSSTNWTQGSGPISFNLGSQMIIPAATTSTLEIKADLQTTGNVNYTLGTVSATLNTGSSNAQGQSSNTTLNFPTSSVAGTSLAIQTGLLAVSQNTSYTNQTVNPNTVGVKIGSFMLQNQSSSEPINVTSLNVGLSLAAPTYTAGTVTSGSQAITVSSSTGFTIGNVITIPGATPAIGNVTAVTDATHIQVNITTPGVTPTVGGAITGSGSTSLATLTNFSNLRTSQTSGSGATPVQPNTTNNFSVNFQILPGQTQEVDVLADTSTANMGNIVATLTASSLGANSHVQILQNGNGTAVNGQNITLGAGSLSTPTLTTSNTTTAEFIATGSTTGVTSAAKADFNVVATNGSATISELRFISAGTSGAVTSVTVNGVSAPTVNNIAYLTGLSIPVANGGAGADIVAYSSFAPVGSTGIASGSTSTLSICSIKYTIGGTTTTSGDTTCGTPLLSSGQTMKLVASAPIVTVATPTGAVLGASSTVEAIDVTVAANNAGPIKVNSFNVVSSLTPAGSAFSAAPIVVKDANNNTVATLTASACTAAATCTVTVSFGSGVTAAPYLISAGQSQTFKVFLPVNTLGGSGTLPNTFMNTHLTATAGGTDFVWTDTAGNAAGTQGDATLIYNYPSTYTSQVHN
jgi:hypothetical protein